MGGFWSAGQQLDPVDIASFVWKVLTPNGFEEWPMNYTNWMDSMYFPSSTAQGELCLNVFYQYYYYYYWDNVQCSTEMCYMCEYETVMPFGSIGEGYNCSGNILHWAT